MIYQMKTDAAAAAAKQSSSLELSSTVLSLIVCNAPMVTFKKFLSATISQQFQSSTAAKTPGKASQTTLTSRRSHKPLPADISFQLPGQTDTFTEDEPPSQECPSSMSSMHAEKMLEGICAMKNPSPPPPQHIDRSTNTSQYLLEDYLQKTFPSSLSDTQEMQKSASCPSKISPAEVISTKMPLVRTVQS